MQYPLTQMDPSNQKQLVTNITNPAMKKEYIQSASELQWKRGFRFYIMCNVFFALVLLIGLVYVAFVSLLSVCHIYMYEI